MNVEEHVEPSAEARAELGDVPFEVTARVASSPCGNCERPIRQVPRQKPRLYCDRTCQQRAYEKRTHARRLEAERQVVDELPEPPVRIVERLIEPRRPTSLGGWMKMLDALEAELAKPHSAVIPGWERGAVRARLATLAGSPAAPEPKRPVPERESAAALLPPAVLAQFNPNTRYTAPPTPPPTPSPTLPPTAIHDDAPSPESLEEEDLLGVLLAQLPDGGDDGGTVTTTLAKLVAESGMHLGTVRATLARLRAFDTVTRLYRDLPGGAIDLDQLEQLADHQKFAVDIPWG